MIEAGERFVCKFAWNCIFLILTAFLKMFIFSVIHLINLLLQVNNAKDISTIFQHLEDRGTILWIIVNLKEHVC